MWGLWHTGNILLWVTNNKWIQNSGWRMEDGISSRGTNLEKKERKKENKILEAQSSLAHLGPGWIAGCVEESGNFSLCSLLPCFTFSEDNYLWNKTWDAQQRLKDPLHIAQRCLHTYVYMSHVSRNQDIEPAYIPSPDELLENTWLQKKHASWLLNLAGPPLLATETGIDQYVLPTWNWFHQSYK